MSALTFLECDPWDGFLVQCVRESEEEQRRHEEELDRQWEEDHRDHGDETFVEEVPVELLPEVQR